MTPKTLADISIKISSGLTPLRSNPEFWANANIPWLKTEQLGVKYIYATNEHISTVALDQTSIQVFPENTLSIAMYGEGKTRGNLSIIKKPMTTNQACCNVQIDPLQADFEYVYYYLKTQYDELRNLSSGVRKNLNSNDIKNYPIDLPVVGVQKKIAAVLSSLDAKIELNNRINEELEGMAKTLYDYWFVQFDFPMSKEQAAALGNPALEGKPYKTSGGKMVYNPTLNREIPEGWDAATLGDCFQTALGGTPSRKNESYWSPGEVSWLSSGEKSDLFVVEADEQISCEGLENSAAKILPAGTVILSIVRHLRASILAINSATNQSVVGIQETEAIKHSYLFPLICREIPRYMALRTGAQQPHINKAVVDETSFAFPDESVLTAYSCIADPLFKRIKNNQFENQRLAELRDWLLPMLMNGQATVE